MRCYSHLSDDHATIIFFKRAEKRAGARKRTDWFGRSFRPYDRRDRPSDRPSEVDGLARTLPRQAAERARCASVSATT
jgi:hypothetical protein